MIVIQNNIQLHDKQYGGQLEKGGVDVKPEDSWNAKKKRQRKKGGVLLRTVSLLVEGRPHPYWLTQGSKTSRSRGKPTEKPTYQEEKVFPSVANIKRGGGIDAPRPLFPSGNNNFP